MERRTLGAFAAGLLGRGGHRSQDIVDFTVVGEQGSLVAVS